MGRTGDKRVAGKERGQKEGRVGEAVGEKWKRRS